MGYLYIMVVGIGGCCRGWVMSCIMSRSVCCGYEVGCTRDSKAGKMHIFHVYGGVYFLWIHTGRYLDTSRFHDHTKAGCAGMVIFIAQARRARHIYTSSYQRT